MPTRRMAESAAQAPTSLAPTASLLADSQTAGGAAPAAGPGAVAAPPPTATTNAAPAGLTPLLLPTKSASNLASLVARVVSPSAIRERIGAVYNSASSTNNSVDGSAAQPTDVPGLTAALGRAQREIVRLKDEVAALLSAASGRGQREGQAAVQALARARHDSVAGAAAREQAGKDLSSLVDGASE